MASRTLTLSLRRLAPSSNTSLASSTAFLRTQQRRAKGTNTGTSEDRQHVTDRKNKDDLDIQAKEANKGIKEHREHGEDSTSAATSRKDKNQRTAQAKKDHPEAPDTVIGMQDERGHGAKS